jgi:2-polyprenyl-3-methyl-5-hydroxy-6-metoxy-1,4-benzoquinol methylase
MHKKVTKHTCRLCCSDQIASVLNLSGFPKAAQYFLDNLNDKKNDNAIELRICQCASCGLVQLENDPVDYYKNVITAASLTEGSKAALVNEWQPFINKYSLGEKNAIEIGSARGDFLEVLGRLGLKALGLENSAENIFHSREKCMSVKQGYLLDGKNLIDERYALVVCNNFLEHQPLTKEFICGMHTLLREDGIIYISVPNLDYMLQKSCLYEFVADHLVYFTEATLKLAFEMNSFEVLEQYYKNNGNDLVLVAKPKKILDLNTTKEQADKIIESVKNVVKKASCAGNKIAIWGAGHRALALMAMAKLEEVECIVDSAAFKQNKLSPILHKKIISPTEFLNSDCDLLIVMLPGNYSIQVIEYLKSNGKECKTIVFEDQVLDAN